MSLRFVLQAKQNRPFFQKWNEKSYATQEEERFYLAWIADLASIGQQTSRSSNSLLFFPYSLIGKQIF